MHFKGHISSANQASSQLQRIIGSNARPHLSTDMHLLRIDRDSGDSEAGLQPVFSLSSDVEVALVDAGFLTYSKPRKDVGDLRRSSRVLLHTSRGLQ